MSSSKDNIFAATSSSPCLPSAVGLTSRDHSGSKKRQSSTETEESNVRNSQQLLRESINALNFPYAVSFEQCRGIDDVHVAPTYMEFKDGSEGELARQTLTIRNLGAKAAVVRVHKPNSMLFQLRSDPNEAHKLYPGLSLSVLVVYSYKQPSTLHAMIPIEINGTSLDYHLICTFSSPQLVVEPASLDFGCVDFQSVSDVKIVSILNGGGKTGRFSVDAGKHHHLINIQPNRGLIKPNQKIQLKVQILGKYEGTFDGCFWIKSHYNICISVKVKIFKPMLLVDSPTKVNESVLVNFPSAYLETRSHQSVKLKNLSSQATSFVILSKDCNHLQSISEIDTTKNPSFGVFDISPSEGRLRPFEEATLSISFCPTFKKLELLQKLQKDRSINHFVAVIKVAKVEVAEAKRVLTIEPKQPTAKVEQNIPKICATQQPTSENANVETTGHDDSEEAAGTTLYLHGGVEIPCLQFRPEELRLSDLNVNERVEQSICIRNPSAALPLKFAFVAQPWVRCQPCRASLKPKQSVQVAVAIRAQYNLDAVFYLEFDVWASSVEVDDAAADDDDDGGRSTSVAVCRLSLKCTYNPLKAPAADTSLRCVCRVDSQGRLPPEPDYSLTHTPSELRLKLDHRDYWARYLSGDSERARRCATEDSFYSDDARHCGDRLILKPYASARQRSSRASGRGIFGNRSLTPLQLFKVRVSPLRLDFGKVVKHSLGLRRLSFENDNDFEIAVRLTSPNDACLSFPERAILSVGPRSRATCSVQFRAEHLGHFIAYVNYAINREHRYQLPVLADVVFKSLKLKVEEIVFDRDCHPLEGYRLPFRHVEIENALNADTAFRWILPENANFSIDPPAGRAPAGKNLRACVYHEANAGKSNRIEATIQDEDQACVNLRLEAVLRAPNVLLVGGDNTDVGQVPLNLARRARNALYNAEYFPVFFEVDERSLVKGCVVSPARGSIKPRGVVVLTVRLLFDACVEGSAQVDVTVQKRLNLQWTVKFSVVFPRLEFEPSVVEWSGVCVNEYRVQRVLASNLTDADVLVRFLLDKYNEFHVSSTDFKSCVPITRGDGFFKIRPKSTIQLYLHFSPCDLAHYSIRLPIVINELLGPASIEGGNDLEPTKFFKSDNDEYYSNFKGLSFLPIPAKMPGISVNAIVTHPIVSFNQLSFHFTDTFRQDKWKCRNNSADAVTLILYTKRCSEEDNFPFVICWISGSKPATDENCITMLLKPEEEVHFRIIFKPTEARHYVFELPINLKHNDTEQTYNKLILDGSLPRASIESDVLEVNLAPVPLQTRSKQRFDLRVSDFAEASVLFSEICCSEQCSLLPECKLLDVSFPRGNAIKPYCSHNVEVEIQFASSVPVSLRTSVVFFDERKTSSFSVVVCARADNSLLTTHTHGDASRENFLLRKVQIGRCRVDSQGEAAPTTRIGIDKREVWDTEGDFDEFEDESSHSGISHASSGSITHYLSVDATNEKNYSQAVVEAIEAWLYDEVLGYEFNPTLLDGTSLTALRSELLETMSKNDKKKDLPKLCTYIDVLQRLANPDDALPFQQAYPEGASASGDNLVVEVSQIYKKILEFLLSKGALVSHVSAECLLDYKDYKVLVKNNRYRLDKDTFQFCSQRAWVDLLLQSYKVFAMAQISEDALANHAHSLSHAKSIDGLPDAKYAIDVGDIVKRSRKLTRRVDRREALLLSWLEYSNALYYEHRAINEFGECLSDGLAFVAVTRNYCPFLRDFFTNIYHNPVDVDQKIHNAVCLLLAWKKIRLGFTLTPSQIAHPNAIQMLMLTRHLFNHLPTYLIRSKVTFACPLTKSISVQIRLPISVNRQASYAVQFVDNDLDAFTSKAVVPIKPRKNQQVKVNFFARKIGKTKAYLILCGSTIGPHFAENLVFLLEGLPNELEISESFVFATKLYQIVKKNLTVNVPYEYPEQYEIWISRERPNSIDELAMAKWESAKSSKHTLNRLTFHDTSIATSEENLETADIALSLCCLTCASQSFWIIFRSKSADFIVQITSNYRISITDNVTIEASGGPCICPNFPLRIDFECPLIYQLLIPADNIQLHNCILKLFKNSLTDEDKNFWTTYLENIVGLRFVKWFVKDSSCSDTDGLFNPKQMYIVTTDKNSRFLQQDNVTNENGSDEIRLTIHIRGDVKKTIITLTSWDKKEIRQCQVDILSEKSSVESVRSMPRKK